MAVTQNTHPYRQNRYPNRKDIVKAKKGCLEVITNCDSEAGESGYKIPKNTVGYVMVGEEKTFLILWPTILEPIFGNIRCNRPVISSHVKTDLEITGRRG